MWPLPTEEDLAQFTDEELAELSIEFRKAREKLKYGLSTSGSKFQRRLRDIREGKDPDIENPISRKEVKSRAKKSAAN